MTSTPPRAVVEKPECSVLLTHGTTVPAETVRLVKFINLVNRSRVQRMTLPSCIDCARRIDGDAPAWPEHVDELLQVLEAAA